MLTDLFDYLLLGEPSALSAYLVLNECLDRPKLLGTAALANKRCFDGVSGLLPVRPVLFAFRRGGAGPGVGDGGALAESAPPALAVITGGTSGMALATAELFVEEGVYALSRSRQSPTGLRR